MEWKKKIILTLKETGVIKEGFTGKLQMELNIHQGGLTDIHKTDDIIELKRMEILR